MDGPPVSPDLNNGRIDVAWYDYRDDTYPAPQPDPDSGLTLFNNMRKQDSVYVTSSVDGGRTGRQRAVNDVRIDRTKAVDEGRPVPPRSPTDGPTSDEAAGATAAVTMSWVPVTASPLRVFDHATSVVSTNESSDNGTWKK
ncbi:MAG: hypothetical protein KY462_16515 [Actinobacteria bacterium]|nr:hypothetical protein [Actinomycetota bacterium]